MRKPILICALILIAVPVFAQYKYQVINHPSGTWTLVGGINNNGLIVGSCWDTGPSHPFSYRLGKFFNVGEQTAVWQSTAEALKSNNRGDVVGYYRMPDNRMYGYIQKRDGELIVLSYPGAMWTAVWGINDEGVVVGSYGDADQDGNQISDHGFVWYKGKFVAVDYPSSGNTRLVSINSRGEILGWHGYYLTGDSVSFFVYYKGKFTDVPFAPEGYPWALTWDISDTGTIVGMYYTPDFVGHGAVFSNGVTTRVDYPGAEWMSIYGINAAGQMTGTMYLDGQYRGFLIQPEKMGKPGME